MGEKKETVVFGVLLDTHLSLKWRNICYMRSFFAKEHAMIFRELQIRISLLGQVLFCVYIHEGDGIGIELPLTPIPGILEVLVLICRSS